ncbi:MAG TPA: helicase-related protein, partial [Vicinamibacterales bacterium]|nr:helicase-related protein [Vicinamibacterales bacterium]
MERHNDCDGLGLAPCTLPDVPFGTLLVPFDRPHRVGGVATPRAVRPRKWLHAIRHIAVRQHPFGALRSAGHANIDLHPYQLEPALAIRRHGHLRVLVADAVGLGKTIQAGLVLAEVLASDASARALVIVPAGLRQQWQRELRERFGIETWICDAEWLRRRARDLPADTNPWSLPGTFVVSLDFVRQVEVSTPMQQLAWDLTVVDEAHVVTLGTDRRTAVDAIAARARRLMLLTATPHAGDEAQFAALCRIGEGSARTPLVMFHRRRSDVGPQTRRRSTLLRVRLSDAEQRMHELLDRYTSRLWRESRARGDRVSSLIAIVLRKRALSSARSLAASVSRRIDLLATAERDRAQQLALPIYARDEESDDDGVSDGVLGAPGLTNGALERRWLAAILEVARRAAGDERKIARLRRYLSRVHEPAIVFTEYRDTLARLAGALAGLVFPVLTLHGGMSAAERDAVQRAFNCGDAILLATDAAAEGLNLQQRCRLVIHFELPWNPLRLEQRVGRVDRIGQSRRVHEVALIAEGTAELIVLAPLARRARTAMTAAPADSRMLELLSELRVAECVLAERRSLAMDFPQVAIAPPPPLAIHASEEAARLAESAAWLARERNQQASRTDAPVIAALARRSTASDVTLVYSLSLLTPDGNAVHSELLVLGMRVGRTTIRVASDAVRSTERIMAERAAAIDHFVGARLAAIQARVAPLHEHMLA